MRVMNENLYIVQKWGKKPTWAGLKNCVTREGDLLADYLQNVAACELGE